MRMLAIEVLNPLKRLYILREVRRETFEVAERERELGMKGERKSKYERREVARLQRRSFRGGI